jgi:hypothetical protein
VIFTLILYGFAKWDFTIFCNIVDSMFQVVFSIFYHSFGLQLYVQISSFNFTSNNNQNTQYFHLIQISFHSYLQSKFMFHFSIIN